MLLELLRLFVFIPTKRTLTFNWFSCLRHRPSAMNKKIKLRVNVDTIGSILGEDCVLVIAYESRVHIIDYVAKRNGFTFNIGQSIYLSECVPFSDASVPTISFVHFETPGCSSRHNQ